MANRGRGGGRRPGQQRRTNGQNNTQRSTPGSSSGPQLELPNGYTAKKSKPNNNRGKKTGGHINMSDKNHQSNQSKPEPELPFKLPTPVDVDTNALARLRQQEQDLLLELEDGAILKLPTTKFCREGTTPISMTPESLAEYEKYQSRKFDPEFFSWEPTTLCEDNDLDPEDDDVVEKFASARDKYYELYKTPEATRIRRNMDLKGLNNITLAPFVWGNKKPRQKMTNRNIPIFKAMVIPEIRDNIMTHIRAKYFDMCAIAQTCHTGFEMIAGDLEIYDMAPPGDFMLDNIERPSRTQKLSSTTLMASPVRKGKTATGSTRRVDYVDEFDAQVQLFKALSNRFDSITNLHIHRSKFMDTMAAELIIAALPKLRNIGIYQCPLLHLGKTTTLLQIVKKYPKCGELIRLDFFPMFHQGPPSLLRDGSFGVTWNDPVCDTTAAILQIVLYEIYPMARKLHINKQKDLDQINADIKTHANRDADPKTAIADARTQIPHEKTYYADVEASMDPLVWGSAFRRWLEKCPLPEWCVVRVYEAIKQYEAATGRVLDLKRYRPQGPESAPAFPPVDMNNQGAAPATPPANPAGTQAITAVDDDKPVPVLLVHPTDSRLNAENRHFKLFTDELFLAIRGDSLRPAVGDVVPETALLPFAGGMVGPRLRKYGWWRHQKIRDNCERCRKSVLGIFCPFGEGRCWGCLLKMRMDGQWDHYKTYLRRATVDWFRGCRTLDHVTEMKHVAAGRRWAMEADHYRHMENTFESSQLAEDFPRHLDFPRVERRHARHFQSHGPIDRKTDDYQYIPLGSVAVSLSLYMLPKCWWEYRFESQQCEKKWRIKRAASHPKEAPAQREAAFQAHKKAWRKANELEEKVRQAGLDRAAVMDGTRQRNRWIGPPNRKAGTWDGLRFMKLANLFPELKEKKKKKPIAMDEWEPLLPNPGAVADSGWP